MWQSCFRAVAGTGSYFNKEALAHWQRVTAITIGRITKNDLSERELQLLQLLAQEYNNKKMADQLNLSTCTVGNNLSGLYKKLGVNGRLGALIWGWQVGLIGDVFEEQFEMADG